jgi:L-threonylcarbamoyladenylate synthase
LAKILRADESGVREAAKILKRDGIISYPTDTVFGLGCNPFSLRALTRLIEAKGERKKPLPVLVANLNQAEQLANFNPLARVLAGKFWPGPLTLVLPLRRQVPELLTAGQETIGLRCPNHRIALSLIQHVQGFLVGTSANMTGKPPCLTHEEVLRVIGTRIDAIIEGQSGSIAGSSVIEIQNKGYLVLREGTVSRAQIDEALATLGQ